MPLCGGIMAMCFTMTAAYIGASLMLPCHHQKQSLLYVLRVDGAAWQAGQAGRAGQRVGE
jgi:hypothetical protein